MSLLDIAAEHSAISVLRWLMSTVFCPPDTCPDQQEDKDLAKRKTKDRVILFAAKGGRIDVFEEFLGLSTRGPKNLAYGIFFRAFDANAMEVYNWAALGGDMDFRVSGDNHEQFHQSGLVHDNDYTKDFPS